MLFYIVIRWFYVLVIVFEWNDFVLRVWKTVMECQWNDSYSVLLNRFPLSGSSFLFCTKRRVADFDWILLLTDLHDLPQTMMFPLTSAVAVKSSKEHVAISAMASLCSWHVKKWKKVCAQVSCLNEKGSWKIRFFVVVYKPCFFKGTTPFSN